ncbi:FecR family protein [Oceanibaculum nanhaiense]|uniref:FecR family protein n=1 Tax=Oceanibaculum nanhaiense TaxID=1909734 RepID=UPI003D26F040
MTAPEHRHDPIWEQALDWLFQLQARPEDSALKEAFEIWLCADPRHAEAWRGASLTWQAMGAVTPAHVERWQGTAQPAPRTKRRIVRPVAAVLALAACLALWLATGALWPEGDYRAATGQTRQLVLADGSTVMLESGSALDVAYESGHRAVRLLSGQAFFEVAPDAHRPFNVNAGGVSVTVVGTAFDVELTDRAVRVAVQQGQVEVSAGVENQSAALLSPGEALRIYRGTGLAERHNIGTSDIAAWRSGQLVVDGISVGEAVDRLRRYHRGLILLQDDALAAQKVTGVYDLTDPASALAAILRPHGGTVTQITPYLLILDRG